MSHHRPTRKSFYGDTTTCHLCLLPIPQNIVHQSHPLFATLDHIIPLSQGGKNTPGNRAPAHRHCNNSKGNKLVLRSKERIDMSFVIAPLLIKYGYTITNRMLSNIRKEIRVLCNETKYDALTDILNWENEGGTTYIKYHWKK